MVSLVCIDVDGTLVGSSGTVLPEIWEAIGAAREAGLRLALVSGRPGFGVTRDFAMKLDPDGWHCFQNGASVVHLRTGESHSTPLPLDIVQALIARARAKDRVLELYSDTEYVVERSDTRAREHAELLGVPFRPRPFEELRGTVVRGQWLIAPEDADAVEAEPHEGLYLSGSTAPIMPDNRFINLTRAGVDKGIGVSAIARAYNIPLEHTMYIGDSWNDAAALRIVGWPVAMGNAEEETITLAKHVVADVDNHGVAEALSIAMLAGSR